MCCEEIPGALSNAPRITLATANVGGSKRVAVRVEEKSETTDITTEMDGVKKIRISEIVPRIRLLVSN